MVVVMLMWIPEGGMQVGCSGWRASFLWGVLWACTQPSCLHFPPTLQAEHKIQSSGGPLTLTLRRVPKMLGALRRRWCPSAMVASFKLETDQRLLLGKVRLAGVAACCWSHSSCSIAPAAAAVQGTASRPFSPSTSLRLS